MILLYNSVKEGSNMKINIKNVKKIDVKEVKRINWREIRTISWKDANGLVILGGNVKVKRI